MAGQTGKKKIDLGVMPSRIRINVKVGSTHKHEQYRLKFKGCVFSQYLASMQKMNLDFYFLQELFENDFRESIYNPIKLFL